MPEQDRRVLIRKVAEDFFLVPSMLVWEWIDPCREYEFQEDANSKLWTSFTTEAAAREFAANFTCLRHKPSSIEVIDFDLNSLQEKS